AGVAPQGERLLQRGDHRAIDHARHLEVRAADVPAQDAAHAASSHLTTPSAANRARRRGGPGGGGSRPRQASSASAAMLAPRAARTPRYVVVSRGFTSVTTGPASVSTRSTPM